MSPKDPSEIITVTFDFSDVATAISSPAVSISVSSGKIDADLANMLSGSATVDGLKVLQRVAGGIDGNTYKLRCQVDDADGERYVIGDTLVVIAA